MANSIPRLIELRLKYEVGLTDTGQMKTKSKLYKGVKVSATPTDISAIAQGFASLQNHNVVAVEVIRTDDLVG